MQTKDREIDMRWLYENLKAFLPFAEQNYEKKGRGALLIDHSKPGAVPPVRYMRAGEIELDEYTQRMTRNYDPKSQIVVVILKSERQSSYQIGFKMPEHDARP
jgi:hypothetical protein